MKGNLSHIRYSTALTILCVWIDAPRRGELNTLHKRCPRQAHTHTGHMTNDDRLERKTRGHGGGGSGGMRDMANPAVDWVKASFMQLCACWFKKIIKDIFVVLMSLPSTFSARTLTNQPNSSKQLVCVRMCVG